MKKKNVEDWEIKYKESRSEYQWLWKEYVKLSQLYDKSISKYNKRIGNWEYIKYEEQKGAKEKGR